MKSSLAFIATTLALSSTLAFGLAQDPPLHGPLDEAQIQEMLHRIHEHDPERGAEIQRAMALNPDEAVKHLRHMIHYLHELEQVKAEDPEKHDLMVRQESMERAARDLAEAVHRAETDETREDAIQRLHDHLSAWFELRHELRVHETERLAAELDMHTATLDEKAAHHDRAVEEWLGRITEGGEAGMMERIDHLRNVEKLHALAPTILKILSHEQPEIAQVLAKLAEASPEAFLKALHQIAEEHPQIVELAHQHTDDMARLHMHLQEMVLHIHEMLLPFVHEDDHVEVPEDVQRELEDRLSEVASAEIDIAHTNLDRVRAELERRITIVESREAHRDIIIQMQLSRMIGEEDRFEW